MKKWRQRGAIRGTLGLGALLLAAVSGLVLLGDDVPEILARGDRAPHFDLPRLSAASAGRGSRIGLDDLRGQVVLVNFWATWCKPCEEEMPAMQMLYEALHSRGFELVAISVDESAAPVEEFRDRMALDFPIALDPDQAISRAYQTMGFPESILIDADGRVIERYVGPRDWNAPAYHRRIEKLLGPRSQGD